MSAKSDGDSGVSAEAVGAAAFRAVVAKKREAVKRGIQERRVAEAVQAAANETAKERWSGLRIQSRCVRQEKWDISMKGKELIPLGELRKLQKGGRDQVVIGVLCANASSPRMSQGSMELAAEWVFTDLDKGGPQQATLVLVSRAMEFWSCVEGQHFSQAIAGSIFAILNPSPVCRAATMRVSFETQLLKLGTCPDFAVCPAKLDNGLECRIPYNADGGAGSGYCARHANMSVWARCNEHTARAGLAARSRVGGAANAKTNSASSRGPVGQSEPKSEKESIPKSTTPRTAAESCRLPEKVADALEILLLVGTDSTTSASGIGGDSKNEKPSQAMLLAALHELEALDLSRSNALAQGETYDALGKLVGRTDEAGAAAARLRRRWRAISNRDCQGQAAVEPAAKRVRAIGNG